MKRPLKSIENKVSKFTTHAMVCVLLLTGMNGLAQFNVTEVITDYGGYWKSSATAVNNVKPDNSHNMVSFSYGGKRYATGVNNALLTAQGQSFIPGDYRALPVQAGSAANANTKIGLGYLYDGVANGPSNPAPANNMPYYLTDGVKGLDLGTCVANLPAGTLFFPINKIITSSIGDSIPDLLITQVADPSGSLDRYELTDINGARVGNYVDIQLNNIPLVGNWTADFYEASKNPMTLASGFTKTDRPIRLWASDLSAFGIDSSNASRVAYFRITLSGNSDVAFVAYNNNSINIITSLLPVKLTSFEGKSLNSQVQLSWETGVETNSDVFVIERSTDGNTFTAIGTVPARNNAAGGSYIYTDKKPVAGKNYYRLKMIDKDGHVEYSKIIIASTSNPATGSISMYPNPAKNYIIINHPFAGSNEQLKIINLQGNTVIQQKIVTASLQTRVNLPQLPAGIYETVWSNGKETAVNSIVIQ